MHHHHDRLTYRGPNTPPPPIKHEPHQLVNTNNQLRARVNTTTNALRRNKQLLRMQESTCITLRQRLHTAENLPKWTHVDTAHHDALASTIRSLRHDLLVNRNENLELLLHQDVLRDIQSAFANKTDRHENTISVQEAQIKSLEDVNTAQATLIRQANDHIAASTVKSDKDFKEMAGVRVSLISQIAKDQQAHRVLQFQMATLTTEHDKLTADHAKLKQKKSGKTASKPKAAKKPKNIIKKRKRPTTRSNPGDILNPISIADGSFDEDCACSESPCVCGDATTDSEYLYANHQEDGGCTCGTCPENPRGPE
jgi:hypothetical protein